MAQVARPEGITWYVGAARSGKTELAWRHLAELVSRDGRPALVIDSAGSVQWRSVPHVAPGQEAGLLGEGRSVAITPEDSLDVDRACEVAWRLGRCHVVVDDCGWWIGSARGRGSTLMKLIRAWGHCHVSVQLTTQHFSGDIPQEALSCGGMMNIFRTNSPSALERIQFLAGGSQLFVERVRELQPFDYIQLEC